MQIEIPLSKKQLERLHQVQATNIKGSNNTNPKYIVKFNNKTEMNKIKEKLENGKNVKINGKHVKDVMTKTEGGSIRSAFKKLGKDMKKGFTKAGDAMKQGAFDVNHALKSDRTSRAIIKAVAPALAGEVAGLAVEGGVTYLTGSNQLGKALSRPAKKGAEKGTAMALTTEGYGLKRMKKGKIVPMMEASGGAIGALTDMNQAKVVNSAKLNAELKEKNKINELANNPKLGQKGVINKMGAPKKETKVSLHLGNGFSGYGKGIKQGSGWAGYGK
jgi:hypothetical protein